MRQLRRNKRQLYYTYLIGNAPVYATDADGNVIYDSYTDDDGTVYTYPRETGEVIDYYATPIPLKGNIALSGSESDVTDYGLSAADYAAVITLSNNAEPFAEGCYVWFKSEVQAKYNDEVEITINGQTYLTNCPIVSSADYIVLKKNESLNETRYNLKAVTK